MPAQDGGLGSAFVGEKVIINTKHVLVTKLLGEGENFFLTTLKDR